MEKRFHRKQDGVDANGRPLYEQTPGEIASAEASEKYLAERGKAEMGKGVWQMSLDRLKEDAPASFKDSYKNNKPVFFAKAAGVGLGVVMMADGLHNILSGMSERVEDMYLTNKETRNYVRVSVGTAEIIAGFGVVYYSARAHGVHHQLMRDVDAAMNKAEGIRL